MTFTRIHGMTALGLAACIWVLVQIFTGEAVRFEHFPLGPLDGSVPSGLPPARR